MQFPELEYNFEYTIAQIDEKISIAYTDNGNRKNKEVLLFIHGLSSYIPAWSKLIPLLKDYFRCIAIDLPGYGKSSAGVHAGSMTFYADVISKFIKKLDLQKVCLVGHSMGGQISIVTALEHPSQVEKLILLAPAGFETFTDDEKAWVKKNNSPEILALLSEKQIRYNFGINFFSMPNDVEPMINDRIKMKVWKNYKDYCKIVSNSLYGLLDYSVFNKLHLISQPTLVQFGKNDRLIPNSILHKNITPEKIAIDGASQIPNARLVMIDKCGHFIQFEKPDIIATEIINFLT